MQGGCVCPQLLALTSSWGHFWLEHFLLPNLVPGSLTPSRWGTEWSPLPARRPASLLLDAVSPSCAAELLKKGVARSTGLAGSVSRMEGSVYLSLDPPAPFATWQHLFSGSLTCPVWEGGVGES